MNILVLSQYWHPENGIPQRRWTWLTRILNDAGHDVTVIAPPPHYERRISFGEWRKRRGHSSSVEATVGLSGERIVRSGFIPADSSLTRRILNQATVALGALWVIMRRPGDLKGYSPDLIIGTVPALPTAAVTALAARYLKAPYIIDLRDAWPDLLNDSSEWNRTIGAPSVRERLLSRGPLQALTFFTRKILHISLRNAAALTVTSSHLEQSLMKRPYLKKSGHPPLTTTIRNVFPPETVFEAVPAEDVRPGQLNVLYAGTLGRAQNLANVVDAAKLARDQGVDLKLRFVGAGVARNALVDAVKNADVDASFINRQPADELVEHYQWADTALVHLTDWEPLSRAVPSKLYELMTTRIHITGVVAGEAADLIRTHGAGDVVAPEDPEGLAALWTALARDRGRLQVSDDAAEWVRREREEVAPERLLDIVAKAVGEK